MGRPLKNTAKLRRELRDARKVHAQARKAQAIAVGKHYWLEHSDGSQSRIRVHRVRRAPLEPRVWWQFCGEDGWCEGAPISMPTGEFVSKTKEVE
jgi:hypothetical protein